MTGLQFDICYVIETRAALEIAGTASFKNYFSSYLFAL